MYKLNTTDCNLPTLLMKNKNSRKQMRLVHILETGTCFLLPKGVYVYYNGSRVGQEPRWCIKWGVPGSNTYTYNHTSISGLLTAYNELITSDVSLKKCGLFDSNGMMNIISSDVKVHYSRIFKIYKTEFDALVAMRAILKPLGVQVDITEILQSDWNNLKDIK